MRGGRYSIASAGREEEAVKPSPETLILGWGNPGRRDDGLGPAFIDALAQLELPGVEVDSNYQLQIEDAERISRFGRVVFVDADLDTTRPFRLQPIRPANTTACFTTHHVAPESLLALSRELFHHQPEAWVLGIAGYEFDEFAEGLSAKARRNLTQALDYLVSIVRDHRWSELTPRPGMSPTKLTQEGAPCLEKSP